MKRYILALALLFAACTGGPKYVIESGSHSSGAHFAPGIFQEKGHAYDVMFTESCKYVIDRHEQGDWDKLCGQSASLAHQENSMRFAWRCTADGQLQITPYLHIDGNILIPNPHWIVLGKNNRMVKGPVPVEPGVVYRIAFHIYAGTPMYYVLDTKEEEIYRAVDDSMNLDSWPGSLGYALFPWFGGTCPAPHDITLYVRELDWSPGDDDIPITVFEDHPTE